MSSLTMRPCGDFRTSYKQDNTIFETKTIKNIAIIAIAFLCAAPYFFDAYYLTLFIQISYLGIAA
jgi:branched-chain amino acid transport system permease protein